MVDIAIMTIISEAIGQILQGDKWLSEPIPPYDQEIAKRFGACLDSRFPVCLDLALQEIFGEGGMDLVKSIAKKGTNLPNVVDLSTPKDIWKLYVQYIIAWKKVIGDDSTKVVESKSLAKMKDLHCEKCPMYELELLRLRKNP